jgi:YidC/Oxa1 family membrane protein insertase
MHGISEESINFLFLGLNLLTIPSFFSPSPELVIPFLAVGSALGFCLVQNVISPGALSQSKGINIGLTVFTVALSLYLTLVLPVAVGLYWTASNIVGVGAVVLLNLMYSPKKLAPEALAYIDSTKKTKEELRTERRRTRELKAREKKDTERFKSCKKELVFYALTGGQFRYYKTVIEYILANSSVNIHYLTNDPEDALFQRSDDNLKVYYAGQRKTISLLLKLDADIMVTTVPDLQVYHIKRSIVRDDIEYIYMFHAPHSTFLVVREKSFDHFDTIFCVGPHQVAELRRREELAGLPSRTLVKTGYGQYDHLLETYTKLPKEINSVPKILIAPSWQEDNILEICIDSILDPLLGFGYEIVVRPHNQFTQLFPERMSALEKKYAKYIDTGEIVFELDFSSNDSIFMSDLLITDWSGIAYEFSYCTSKPCIFINTPMKVSNPNWKDYGIEPTNITLREKIGTAIEVENIAKDLKNAVAHLLSDDDDSLKKQIYNTLRQYLYYPGRSGEAGGKYIISKLQKKGHNYG